MIESALLWYDLFFSVLKDMVFVLDQYYMCVTNKTINGNQCTVAWYVDDNKISHVEQEVVDNIVAKIRKRFPGLTISTGTEHTFLGIRIKYLDYSTVSLNMRDYIQEVVNDFGEDVSQMVSTPAARWLFAVSNARKLKWERVEMFSLLVAKLLWVFQCVRVDCSPAVAFLCTRVKNPDVEDWKKLKRLISFLHQTIDDVRIIGADDLLKIQNFIDSSHAVHEYMKGHTGGTITFGTGVVSVKSSKQKMNLRSSNETEVIGDSEYLPLNVWFQCFMEAQGYTLGSNLLWQENEGAQRMAENRNMSCSSKSRHIAIKFFWITDRVKQGLRCVQHCPTDIMLADFFTKPLQGSFVE